MTTTLVAEAAVGAAEEGSLPYRRSRPAWAKNRKVLAGAALIGFFVVVAVIGPMVSPYDPSATSSAVLAPPSAAHLLGTTATGQDVLSEVLTGARLSLLVGFVAALIGEGLAVVIGITAGYLEGVAGDALNALINLFLVIPVLPLEIVLAGYLTGKGWLGMTLIISVTAWPWGARLLRAQTRSIRKRDYVEAAKVAGDSARRIVGFEILPNVTALIVTGTLFHVLLAIVVQTSLAFLGVGSVSAWSWGTVLYWSSNSSAFLDGAWWWYVPPGLCVALIGMGLALVNLGLDEVINPKLRLSGVKMPKRGRLAAVTGSAGSGMSGAAGGAR